MPSIKLITLPLAAIFPVIVKDVYIVQGDKNLENPSGLSPRNKALSPLWANVMASFTASVVQVFPPSNEYCTSGLFPSLLTIPNEEPSSSAVKVK